MADYQATWDEPRFCSQSGMPPGPGATRETGRPDLARPTAEEARDLVERIGLGALREDVEALLRELEVA
jgi:hypothetical protein